MGIKAISTTGLGIKKSERTKAKKLPN